MIVRSVTVVKPIALSDVEDVRDPEIHVTLETEATGRSHYTVTFGEETAVDLIAQLQKALVEVRK